MNLSTRPLPFRFVESVSSMTMVNYQNALLALNKQRMCILNILTTYKKVSYVNHLDVLIFL